MKKTVPGLKIIGLSSEIRRAMEGKGPEEEEEEEEEEEDEDDDEDGEGEEEEDSDDEDGEEGEDDDEDGEEDDDASEETKDGETSSINLLKTPKVTIRKVMKVATPGGGADYLVDDTPRTEKKRGRPSKAALMAR